MTEEPASGQIDSFQELWKENTHSRVSFPQVRLDLETHLTQLLTRIEQEWYDTMDVLQTAEEVIPKISDSISPQLESAYSTSLTN